MSRVLLAVLGGVPLALSLFFVGLLVLFQASQGFDIWLAALVVLFSSCAAFLLSVLVGWMRQPLLELPGNRTVMDERSTRQFLLRVFASIGITAALIVAAERLVR